MALPWSNNWACKAIHNLMRQDDTDASVVATTLAAQPEFLAAIQTAIDDRKNPNYDPDMPDCDPAQHAIGNLMRALEEV